VKSARPRRDRGVTEEEAVISTEQLITTGFRLAGRWESRDGLTMIRSFEVGKAPGVYAYAVDGVVMYVGSAQRGLQRRMRHYEISLTMRTAAPIRATILECLGDGRSVEVYLLPDPPTISWNTLPVNLIAGIEEGLIRALNPAWNIRSNSSRRLSQTSTI
jgi:hypothetical protein